jgi:hypothetical protein
LILEEIQDVALAASLLPRCGNQISALQSLILTHPKRAEISVNIWIGQVLSVPTALAVLDVLNSNELQRFQSAIAVNTDQELATFRANAGEQNIVH